MIKKGEREIFRAIEFATRAHRGKYRKGTRIPYIVHPLGVARILIEHGCPGRMVIAGILHDTVEDTPVTPGAIERRFGERIAFIVKGVSEPNQDDTWENRKNHTIEFLKKASTDILLVSMADKLDNIRAIREDYIKQGEKIWARFRRPRKQQKWYYQSLVTVFKERAVEEPLVSLFRSFRREVRKVFR